MKTKQNILSICAILLCIAVISITFFACKKIDKVTKTDVFTNTIEVVASISGQVLDESGVPLAGATVSVGNNVFTTSNNGIFFFPKITTKENATLITVSKTGFFKGYRTLSILKNKDNFTKISVLQKNNSQSFSANTDAIITSAGGAKIEISKNSIMNAASGAAYNGVVQIYAKTISTLDANIAELTPGALRGINSIGQENALATYGMIAVEMYDASGNPVQIATGKQAQIRMPIAADQLSIAPAEIALWHFDETTGMWTEDGKASKSGNEYIGKVSHFSYWNCDYGSPLCQFDATFLDSATNFPLANLEIKLISNAASAGTRYGYTNSTGNTIGGIPQSTSYTLQVIDQCNNILYTTTFATTTVNISLGTILINLPVTSAAFISGNVVDCSSNILANAPVIVTNGNNSCVAYSNASGVFSYATTLCVSPTAYNFVAYHPTTFVSGTASANISTGANAIGTIAACGVVNEFINYSITDASGTQTFNYLAPVNYFYSSYSFPNTSIFSQDSQSSNGNKSINFSFDGASTTGSHNLVLFNHYNTSGGAIANVLSGAISLPASITQYGPASGDFMGGSFGGSFTTTAPVTTYTISGSFVTKRDF